MNRKLDASQLEYIYTALQNKFPDAHCELNFRTPFELLIATILSAQCTDERVNQVTASLFEAANTPEDILALGLSSLEGKIRSLGLFHNKAKSILATSQILVEKYSGIVPESIDLLRKLPGVGRKTANVVVSNAYGIPAIAVDTHVFRVAHRIGLAEGSTAEKVEKELMEQFPREQWSDLHHLLIFLGRRICTARKPNCPACPVASVCKMAKGHEL
ncbi:endonuclease III, DNA-(apurinic or apyrimidinic site) lyase [Desulfosporosinus acidiphilus SJ4]|uniref:Endonuclease III n=1 Tax=Desulfosporosinus acidiphilus (strain DSM 22704 / JCM 16185 / SJ4) TaxID=646529 RepID=I4D8D9_DESAJ|nr:endonuclease III [Desulfosporosinus acidiphilus]AFM42063.1 endonuclease III, DNA-(apurinic or apyrimidinic site) lyase [Desulfosporosinus acidiphilus SJ4]